MKRSYRLDGVRVANVRQALGAPEKPITQTDLADRLGVHRITITQIENGKANASLDLLERLVMVSGRTREWLLGEPEQIDPVHEQQQRINSALGKIAAGFDELGDLMDVLNDRVRETTVKALA